jgi:hypothetical protein
MDQVVQTSHLARTRKEWIGQRVKVRGWGEHIGEVRDVRLGGSLPSVLVYFGTREEERIEKWVPIPKVVICNGDRDRGRRDRVREGIEQ